MSYYQNYNNNGNQSSIERKSSGNSKLTFFYSQKCTAYETLAKHLHFMKIASNYISFTVNIRVKCLSLLFGIFLTSTLINAKEKKNRLLSVNTFAMACL